MKYIAEENTKERESVICLCIYELKERNKDKKRERETITQLARNFDSV